MRKASHCLPISHKLRQAGFALAIGATTIGLATFGLPPLSASAATVGYSVDKPIVSDSLNRTVSEGWGAAQVGGPYSISYPRGFSANGSAGVVAAPHPGASLSASLPNATATDAEASTVITIPAIPRSGSGLYYGLQLRSANGSYYQATARIDPNANVLLKISRVNGSTANQSVLAGDRVVARGVVPGARYSLGFQVTGGNPVSLEARAWPEGKSAPAWQASARDSSSKRLTGPGAVGIWTYVSSASAAAPMSFDNLVANSLKPASEASQPAPAQPAPAQSKPAPAAPAPTAPAPAAPAPTAGAEPAPAASDHPVAGPPASANPKNAGVPSGTKLQVHDGDLKVTTPNAVINAMDIRGRVIIAANNVTISNSVVRGRPASSNIGMITSTSPNFHFTVTNSEIFPSNPSPYVSGIVGSNFTASKVNIHGVIDAVDITGDNIVIDSSWLHDNLHFAKDPNHSDGSHDDSIQIQSGKNIRISNNTITGAHNAALMITQDAGHVANVSLTNNFIDGGACSINVVEKRFGPIVGLSIVNNTFGVGTTFAKCSILLPQGMPATTRGNHYSASNVAVKVIPRS